MSYYIINKQLLTSFFLITVFISLLVQPTLAVCSTECAQTVNGCRVCFSQCDQPRFYYDSCSKLSHQQVNSNNSNSSGPTYLPIGRQECQKQCCDISLQKFKVTQFSLCPTSSQINLMIPIIFVSVLIILFVILCCIFSGVESLRQKFLACFCDKLINRKIQKQEEQVNASIEQIVNSQVLTHQQINGELLVKSGEAYCSICLDGGSNILTHCGHTFHLQCLAEWIYKKQECPICKSNSIDKISVFCKKCFKNCGKQVSFKSLSRIKLMELQQLRCSSCIII